MPAVIFRPRLTSMAGWRVAWTVSSSESGVFLWDESRLFAGSEDMYVGLLPLCIAWHFIGRFGTESAELEFLLMLQESRRRITDMISSRFSDTGRFPNK